MEKLTVIALVTRFFKLVLVLLIGMTMAGGMANAGDEWHRNSHKHWGKDKQVNVQLGPRPFYLVKDMEDSGLKTQLEQCFDGPVEKTDFSIGHRGASLQFPEHTVESYEAAARMGAGILECDVTFTQDRELVCRHSQCDLQATTDILLTPLADKCSQPFTPAEFDPQTGELIKPASAMCCTSDITLEEFKSLCGKMDASNPYATTIEDYVGGTSNWRTDLYATCGTVISHAESIELFKELGVKMTPELKSPSVEMPYEGDYTQEKYAQQMIDEYKKLVYCPARCLPSPLILATSCIGLIMNRLLVVRPFISMTPIRRPTSLVSPSLNPMRIRESISWHRPCGRFWHWTATTGSFPLNMPSTPAWLV
jgi:glycerophosphoryl diester phosphodiesterase